MEPTADTIDNVTVYSISTTDIRKTTQSQCDEHRFAKLNDEEVKCTICPTVLIVGNADSFLLNYK